MITEEQFREEALAFLDANAKPRQPERTGWGEGSDTVGLFAEKTREQELAELAEAKAWKGLVFDAGFGWITGPAQYGGRALPAAYDRAWQSLSSRYDTPSQQAFGIGLGMVAPTILAHATDKVKDLYLRDLYRGDIVACQLFSEPGAGSDLAGLQTRAVRDGDEWVVTGQKVWTAGAQFSDIGEIICRTDPDVPKHKGLTGFVVDMHAPGVEVRPLRQMPGGASFNEVFFTEVRVPDDHRLGDVNQGWTVALTTLMNERASIGGGMAAGGGGGISRIIELARWLGKNDDPLARQALADAYIHLAVAGVATLYMLVRRWSQFWREPLDANSRQLAVQVAFFLIVPVGVLLHEAGHAVATWSVGGHVVQFSWRVYWGFVVPEGRFTAADVWWIALSGNLVSIFFGLAML